MSNVRQLSFSAGEVAPALYGRIDTVKYATGLKTCKNFLVMRHGGVSNRAGSYFIHEVKDSTKKVRLIPFIFNTDQTYVLEFGNLYMRVIHNDGIVLSGGNPYELVTPYVEADLPSLEFVQSADIITITHPSYAPRELARTAHDNWTLTTIVFGASIAAPTGLASSSPGTVAYYKVTSVGAETNEESLPTSAVGSSVETSTLTWNAVTGAGQYNIYKKKNDIYGFIGVAGGTSFVDVTYSADVKDEPPIDRQLFNSANHYPTTVAYYQQRQCFANTNNDTEGIWTSKTALRKNFMKSTPTQDDDPVTFSLIGKQVNAVKHMVDVGKLIVFTASGEWVVEGDAAGILTPTSINPRQHTYNGSGSLAPLIIGGDIVYLQARGSIVRSFAYEFESQGYRGSELSIFSAHFIDGYEIKDWAYQQIPHSIVWAVRDDGVLLGMTYVKEHQLIGWHQHTTDGLFENVCVIPSGNEDALYVVVKRTINGTTKRYIEKMMTRKITDIEDAIFIDCALTYDGTNTTATTMTLSGGTNWTYDEDLTLTASVSYFVAGDVGNEIVITGADGTKIRCRIKTYTSGTVVTTNPHKTVPSAMRNTAFTAWSKAVDEATGLSHLEGKSVSVLGDGFVVANPNNSEYNPVSVTSGKATLDKPYSIIHVGLPIVADIETLNIDSIRGQSLMDKKKHISQITMLVESSRGIWAGIDSDNLIELKIRSDENYDEPVSLKTGIVDIKIKPEWTTTGQILIRQTDPLPLSVLSVVPAGYIASGG